jgi:phage terminase large subunit-like protein
LKNRNIKVHYFAPLVVDETTGEQRSIWPSKWTEEYLLSIAHTRAYLKNFLNDPMGKDGPFWNVEDITHQWLDDCVRTVLWVDPFVKKGPKSDPCGLAVVSYRKPRRVRQAVGGIPAIFSRPMCMVEYANDCDKTGAPLRDVVLKLLEQFPHISVIIVEDNQGKDLWKMVFHNMPIEVKYIHESVNKDIRAEQLHTLYQSRQVVHAERFPKAEAQMVMFRGKNAPGTHDDIIDAIGGPVLRWIKPEKHGVASASSDSYL